MCIEKQILFYNIPAFILFLAGAILLVFVKWKRRIINN